MGMRVDVTAPSAEAFSIEADLMRGLLRGADLVLVEAAAGAPFEQNPRHGVHLRDTGYVRAEPSADVARVIVGFSAFWAFWQHEDMAYHHDHGHAKFLELALLAFGDQALELAAVAVREGK